jgi:nitroreductase
VELDEALARRRADRNYLPDPVAPELIDRLVDAAQRAPTASNVPYRHVLIVDDPAIVRQVRLISAALLANAPALLVVFTDLRLAVERVGPIAALSSAIDSGAAGENVWLAATALGLGTQFTMISAMAGIRVLLGLPDTCRVDLIMPVGHPSPNYRTGAPARIRPPVHWNRYGNAERSG